MIGRDEFDTVQEETSASLETLNGNDQNQMIRLFALEWLLVSVLAKWFSTSPDPAATARQFSKFMRADLDTMTFPKLGPAQSDDLAALVARRVDGHMQRVVRALEQAEMVKAGTVDGDLMPRVNL